MVSDGIPTGPVPLAHTWVPGVWRFKVVACGCGRYLPLCPGGGGGDLAMQGVEQKLLPMWKYRLVHVHRWVFQQRTITRWNGRMGHLLLFDQRRRGTTLFLAEGDHFVGIGDQRCKEQQRTQAHGHKPEQHPQGMAMFSFAFWNGGYHEGTNLSGGEQCTAGPMMIAIAVHDL